MNTSLSADVQAVQSISAVPSILRVVAELTGLRFVCVARVTQEAWVVCAVEDRLGFGLQAGDELDVTTTLCHEVRVANAPIVIDQASSSAVYCEHHTPRQYGFESYISVPVHRASGEFFGTLCGLDPLPTVLSTAKIVDSLTLFAELISRQIEDEQRRSASERALLSERGNSELREQFIAVLGHDLRTPLSSILTGASLLRRLTNEPKSVDVVERIERSARRISNLVDDVVDFTRGRMGGGITLNPADTGDLDQHLFHVIAELRDIYPQRTVISDIAFTQAIFCDPKRIAQLLSNLLVNALIHGDEQPVRVQARSTGKGFWITVSNGGTPIGEEKMAQLFQPFWRGERKASASGLGLGLYIASEIARSHGGTLSVQSDAQATTFTFRMGIETEPML